MNPMEPWVALVLTAVLVLPPSDAAPQSAVHVKFVSAPVSYSHGVTGRVSSSRRTPHKRLAGHSFVVSLQPGNPEAMWPNGVFLPPDNTLRDLVLDSHHLIYDPASDPDPFLLTGNEAVRVVQGLIRHGELFYSDFPHGRVLLRHQDERVANGLAGNRLGSIRPDSIFYRWIMSVDY